MSVWEVRFGDDPSKWNKFLLRAFGIPEDSHSKKEISAARLGERLGHRSFTQQTDELISLYQEVAADEGIVLSPEWQYYLEYMDVVAEHLSPKDKGAEFKKLALEDARSRRSTRPPQFPAELGTPTEFKRRLAGHELEIRKRFNRREQVILIRIYRLPPDEEEDLDPSEEPAGHWEGLKWIPDPPQ